MIEHKMPGKLNNWTLEDLQLDTREVPNTLSPGQNIVAHYDRIVKQRNLENKNAVLGDLFELVVYDQLMKWNVDVVATGVHCPSHNRAEIDMLIHSDEHFGIMCKTSARERWKQVDRDSEVVRRNYPHLLGKGRELHPIMLVLREKPEQTADKARKQVAKLRSQMFSGAEVYHCLDEDGMIKLFHRLTRLTPGAIVREGA